MSLLPASKTSRRRKNRQKSSKSDREGNKNFKLAFRHLPQDLSEEQFDEHIASYKDPSLKIVSKYYVQGSASQGIYNKPIYSRAYILLENEEAYNAFSNQVRGKPFGSLNSTNTVPAIGRALYDRMPNNSGLKKKGKESLEKDDLYQEFLRLFEEDKVDDFSISQILERKRRGAKKGNKETKKKGAGEKESKKEGKKKKDKIKVADNLEKPESKTQLVSESKGTEKERKRKRNRKKRGAEKAEKPQGPQDLDASVNASIKLGAEKEKNPKRRQKRKTAAEKKVRARGKQNQDGKGVSEAKSSTENIPGEPTKKILTRNSKNNSEDQTS
ncbi:uncharacterized protein PRCAT00005308001 [Priceomyces carsonii]|uniref:uncharacterized protein n=1 Tax=Priceomyces carsonii TaxID=28549 RepID=UPI002EDB4D85|nr:unnamed protein product [Priceomyces carsonii]